LIAAPIAIVLFLVEFGLGLMNRFAQQLNVFSLSMPIKSGIAAFLLILYLSFMAELFQIEIIKTHKIFEYFEKLIISTAA